MTDTNAVSDQELLLIASIYTQLQEPNHNLFVMGGNLLLASQNAREKHKDQSNHKAG